ncbi:MAG: hypothetical protein K8S23_15710 [Candidatus Cloacimonetes bacterium]|nr:hypothetical protein [Candidatus Cloacimonadota bacterium]
MKNIIVFNKLTKARSELSEFLQEKGYNPCFTDNYSKLIVLMKDDNFSELYLYIRTLSDIKILGTIKLIDSNLKINLIIPPFLRNIINLLKSNSYDIVDEPLEIV